MGKKRKLAKQIGQKLADDESALVVCVGKKCAPRDESRALVEDLRTYVAAKSDGKVRIEEFGCLGVCKKGPIVATLPDIHIHKRVDAEKGHRLADELAESTP